MTNFFKKAFESMKQSAREQKAVDKANLEAVKAESRANFQEAKMSPSARQKKMSEERKQQIEQANLRRQEAEARISKWAAADGGRSATTRGAAGERPAAQLVG